ncbi:vitrin isoform X15 [Takifugu flavidus]|uniref:vitrin isoform X15 n=1 Tax=Takifugu flavidus TaxID=433684 RepID=UPI0025443190|nr:vitrin isoform X15 [Takifugu flavidus]
MKSAPLAAVCLGLLLSCTCWAKPNGPKGKKPKQVIPAIECDVRAGKINLPEFIAKCPAHCKETKQQVYGSGVFASISSICNAAIHSGVITNAGGKVIVKKMAGQNIYKGSSSNGVRSLSLPKWRESFVVTVGKPKKGVIYPATLDYVPSRPTYVKTSQKEAKSPPVTTELPTAAAPEPTTTTTPQPSSTSSTTLAPSTPPPTTPPPSTPPPATTKARAAVHKVRDAGQRRPEPGATIRRQPSSPAGPVPRAPDSDGGRKVPLDTTYTRVEPVDSWRPDASIYESGYNVREEEPAARVPEPAPQGAPECKVDLVFLMDGSWSIGKRRFKIQKDFLSEVAQTINVGVTGPVMGVVQYGDEPVTEVSLKSASSSRELRSAIEKITQKGGPSHVGKALGYINKQFFSDANGNRGGAPNVAVVLVDGWPTDKVEEASRLARESGINIFFVTIEGADDVEKKNLIENDFVDKAVCRTNGFFSLPVSSWFALRKLVQPLVKRVCDADRLVCSKTCLNANDIAFVIDGSSSVGTGNFRTVLQFVANITREFEISDTDTRVGAVQYTYEQRLEFSFTQHGNKAELLNAIKRINYWSGGTSTGAAISYAAEQLFSKSKPNKRKIMIVITDGRSYDDVRQPALAVHRQDVIAYAVGIAWASQDELEYIATDPDKEHAFFVDEFDNLYKFVPKIVDNICQEFNSQPRN